VEKIRITIASGRDGERAGIAALLAKHDDFVIASMAKDNFDLITAAINLKPNVIVMDSWLENSSSLKLVSGIRRNSPASALIMLCSPKEKLAVNRVLKAGVSGYLLRQQDYACLPMAVRCVSGGGLYISETARRQNTNDVSMDNIVPRVTKPAGLTFTELQTLRGISLGRSDSEIAKDLNITAGTVRNCICQAKKKVGVRNRTQIVLYALSVGLMEWEEGFVPRVTVS